MTYAPSSRVFYDADSHIMELPDWLSGYVDEEMQGRIGRLQLGGAGRLAEQAVQVLPLFLAAHLVSLIVRMLAGGMFPGWELLLAPLFEALLWPVITALLLAPQRRPPDPDQNRPL